MYAELKKLPDKNPPNVIGIFLQSVARYVSIAEIKNDDKAKMKFVECAKLALSKCDGDPPQVVIHPIIQISNYFLQMGSPEPSEDLITYTLKYLKTARAPNFPIQGALTQHLLVISRRKSPEEHRKYCSKLLDETSRPEMVNGSTDAAIAHMHLMRSRILRELNKPDEAYASAQLAADHARKSGNPLQEGEVYVELATAELYKKNYAEAEKLVDAAAAVFPKERADWRFRCYGQKAECLLVLHRDNEYRSLLKQSVQDLSREHTALISPLRAAYLTSCIRNNRKELQRETENLFASLSSTNLKNEPVGITH